MVENNNILYISWSRKDIADTCDMKYFLNYEKNLQSINGSTALRQGAVLHSFFEGYYKTIKKEGWDCGSKAIEEATRIGQERWNKESEGRIFYEDYRTFQNCTAAFIGYLTQFAIDRSVVTILETEKKFELPFWPGDSTTLHELAEGKVCFPYLHRVVLKGKIDLYLDMSGSHWIDEFKTTGSSLQQQKERLHRSAQIMTYTWAANQIYESKPSGCLISHIYISARKNKEGQYGQLSLDYARVPEIFTDEDLINWKISMLDTANRIAMNRDRDLWPMKHQSCYAYNSRCSFLKLCEQNRPFEDLNLEGYMQRPDEELEEVVE
jgi:hypothetical protein